MSIQKKTSIVGTESSLYLSFLPNIFFPTLHNVDLLFIYYLHRHGFHTSLQLGHLGIKCYLPKRTSGLEYCMAGSTGLGQWRLLALYIFKVLTVPSAGCAKAWAVGSPQLHAWVKPTHWAPRFQRDYEEDSANTCSEITLHGVLKLRNQSPFIYWPCMLKIRISSYGENPTSSWFCLKGNHLYK